LVISASVKLFEQKIQVSEYVANDEQASHTTDEIGRPLQQMNNDLVVVYHCNRRYDGDPLEAWVAHIVDSGAGHGCEKARRENADFDALKREIETEFGKLRSSYI